MSEGVCYEDGVLIMGPLMIDECRWLFVERECRYFRHTALTLPLEYNTMTNPSLEGNLTVGGVPPKIVHFTSNKPWAGPQPGSPGHQFLCSSQELAARQRSGPSSR